MSSIKNNRRVGPNTLNGGTLDATGRNPITLLQSGWLDYVQ